MKKAFNNTNEQFRDIWDGFNLLGRITIMPLLIFCYPIIFFAELCMKD